MEKLRGPPVERMDGWEWGHGSFQGCSPGPGPTAVETVPFARSPTTVSPQIRWNPSHSEGEPWVRRDPGGVRGAQPGGTKNSIQMPFGSWM